MIRLFGSALVAGMVGLLVACSGTESPRTWGNSGGMMTDSGGAGATNTGGATGGAANGGTANVGGGPSGGEVAAGGSGTGAGGATASGGASTGGRLGTGGAPIGGAAPTGGATTGTGGAPANGGAMNPSSCATGPGSAFPAITSYTARDGGFGPVDVIRRTGDASLGTDATGAANTVAIFRPAAAKYGQGGVRHPVIVWGNGSTNTVDIWSGFLGRVVTYGFVVVAPEQTQVTADHMNQALDYVLSLANDPASSDCGKIDATRLGSTGYSRGGMGAITVGSNARITSTFFFASNGSVKNIKAPWGVVGGDADTTFSWTAISTAVTGSTQPAFGAALAGIDHNRVAGQAKAQEAYIGWMRWRFMGDQAGHDMFVGASCQICADTTFSGVVKTPTFDSL